jgi:metal-sulfur cluster biosynthetic enzyme
MMKTTTTAQQLDNANPLVKTTASMSTVSLRKRAENERSNDDNTNAKKKRDPIDAYEIFSHIKDVNDPEHPYSLEQLAVVSPENIVVDDEKSRVTVYFTPTVEHCSMATLIGLSIRVQLLRVLPKRFKVDVRHEFILDGGVVRARFIRLEKSTPLFSSFTQSFAHHHHPRSSATTPLTQTAFSLSKTKPSSFDAFERAIRETTDKSLRRLARVRNASEQTAQG